MARTQYETQEDLEREAKVAQLIARKNGDGWVKVPAHYADTCDVVFVRGGSKIVCYCEIRTRTFRWGDYPSVMISLHKYLRGVNLAQTTLVPWLFAVEAKNGIYGYRVDAKNFTPQRYLHTFSGRGQLRDSADLEPIVHLPITDFRCIMSYEEPSAAATALDPSADPSTSPQRIEAVADGDPNPIPPC